MSMAILKSPVLIDQRLQLGSESRKPTASSMLVAEDPRLALEAEARASLEAELKARVQAEYDAKLEAIREDARAEGYRDGLAEGHRDGQSSAQEAFKKKLATLDALLVEAESQLAQWRTSVDERATDQAKEIFCELLGEHALNPVTLQAVIKRVCANLRESDVLAIRLHPVECQILRSALKHANAAAAVRMLDRLQDDATLDAGGVVVDTPRGEYRATLDVQLKRLNALLDEQRAASTAGAPPYHAIRA